MSTSVLPLAPLYVYVQFFDTTKISPPPGVDSVMVEPIHFFSLAEPSEYHSYSNRRK